jgi:hypothetical protein
MSAYPNVRALNVVPDVEPDVPSDEPDGAISWPTVLLEGGEKSGKSYELALFSGCGQFSKTWWIEVGVEGTARMYSRVPGASYKMVRHSGSIPEIMDRLADIHRHAVWTNATGRKPILVVVDSGGAIWRITQAWVDWAARQTDSARKQLRNNPNADISAPINIRNQGTAMWNRFLAALNDIPAVKVVTSRGQEVTKFKNNQPTTEKGWSVVGHKEFGFDVDIWCRLMRNAPAEIIGIRAAVGGIRAGDDAFETEKIRRKDFSLRWLVFDRYALDPSTAYVRPRNDTDDARLADPTAVERQDDIDDQQQRQQRFSEDTILDAAHLLDEAKKTTDKAAFTPLWKEADTKGWAQVPLTGGTLLELLTVEARRIGELERQQAAGEPEVQDSSSVPPAGTAADVPGQPEIVRLLSGLKVVPADWWVVLTGIVRRRVGGLEDVRGESLDLALNELRNADALDEGTRDRILADFVREGEAILSDAGKVSA